MIGEKLSGEILLRSSADLDHPLRDIFRKSPKPFWLYEGTTGLEGVLVGWGGGISSEPGGRADKFMTDLTGGVSIVIDRHCERI